MRLIYTILVAMAFACVANASGFSLRSTSAPLEISKELAPLTLPLEVDAFWGKLDAWDYDGTGEMDVPMPSIEGLYSNSTMWRCHKDTCSATRHLVAVRCPDNAKLLQWLNATLAERLNVAQCHDERDAKGLCDYYIDYIKSNPAYSCTGEGAAPLEQNAVLVADAWNNGRYYTFVVSTWYDMMSNGAPYRTDYFTVDATTGKVLALDDIVDQGKSTLMGKLLWKYLRNGDSMYAHVSVDKPTIKNGCEILRKMDSCALTQDGLLIHYAPYTIGSGADGEFYALIPYKEIKEAMLKLKVKL